GERVEALLREAGPGDGLLGMLDGAFGRPEGWAGYARAWGPCLGNPILRSPSYVKRDCIHITSDED
ncbi:MAG: hypothetical protein LKI40_10940, partial [Olsenella sp.]|nr:hypothetical protein [Olsenella sp.]